MTITYKDIGKAIQIEKNHAHVNRQAMTELRGEPWLNAYLTREQAIILFNDTAERNGLSPMKDPKGYMVLKNNLQEYIKDTYDAIYGEYYEHAEDGTGVGTTYALGAILDSLDKTVRKDISGSLPKGILYSELRFTPVSGEMQSIVQDLVMARAAITLTRSESRKYEKDALEKAVYKFQVQQQRFGDQIAKELGLYPESGLQQ